jgi:NhaA family Na+:H+ antiporter
VPALLFMAFNAGGDGASGWGIPMATDIAFAIGALSLLGTRVSPSLKAFLLALAIVDDIGGIAVIALFYTDDLSSAWLAAGAGVLAVAGLLALLNVRSAPVYALIALIAWLAIHESGVHATIAGVVMALILPVRYGEQASHTSAVDNAEHALHPWSSYLIVPLFALANAGVDLSRGAVADAAASPVSLGIVLALVVGKPVGIALCSLAAVRTGIAALPRGVRWGQILGAGMIAGIGFTVSIFISELAFTDQALVDEAKIGVLAASALVGIAGYVTLRLVSRPEPGGVAAVGG